MKYIKAEGWRFLIAGGLNTVLTYIFYLILVGWMSYTIAFSLSFVAGIFIAFVIYSRFVFQVPLVLSKLFQYPLLYAAQYVAGLMLLALLVDHFGFNDRIAPIVNVIVLTPIMFLLNKWFLTKVQK